MALRATKELLDRRYTGEEFEQMPEFNDGYELLDGKLVAKPMPGGEHSAITMEIRDTFRDFNRSLPTSLGTMLPEVSIKTGISGDRPTPDMSFWKADRKVKIVKESMPLPDLAIEVHSPSDLKSKTDLASAMIKVKKLVDAGVTIVWVIYPNKQQVEVYHAASGYAAGPVQILGLGDTLDGENVIPGFRMPVAALFS